jgi:hypothetical protein
MFRAVLISAGAPSDFSRLQRGLSSRKPCAPLRFSKFSDFSRPLGCYIPHQLMQKEAVSDEVDEAVAVPRVVCEPCQLQVELAKEYRLGLHRGPEGQAPAPGDLLKVLGRRPVLLPALRHDLGGLKQGTGAAI